MQVKQFKVTQDNFTFHLELTDNEFSSPFDDLDKEDNLDHPNNRYNYNGIKDCLKEIETGEHIIDSDYDIYYHIGDYQSDSYWYYGNLESIMTDYLANNPELTAKDAMTNIKRQVVSHVEYLQSYVDSDWYYLDLLVKKITVTHSQIINDSLIVWSDKIETDKVWHLIEWSDLDDTNNRDQIADLLLDLTYDYDNDFGVNVDTLSDICYHIDCDDWHQTS